MLTLAQLVGVFVSDKKRSPTTSTKHQTSASIAEITAAFELVRFGSVIFGFEAFCESPLWVKSRHESGDARRPLCANSRHWRLLGNRPLTRYEYDQWHVPLT